MISVQINSIKKLNCIIKKKTKSVMSEQNALHSDNNNNAKTHCFRENIEQRKRKNISMNEGVLSKQMRSNYFAALACEDDDCDKTVLKSFEKHVNEYKEKRQTSSALHKTNQNIPITKQNDNRQHADQTSNNDKNQNNKIPPINIFDIDTKELIKFLKTGLKINDFQIKQFRNKKSLFLNSLNDHIKVKAYLEKTKTKFFTFTPKSMKNKTYLLKGLESNADMKEIFNELCTHETNELKFLKINQFSTKNSEARGYKLPIYIVQISPESDSNNLKSIKAIDYRIIKWEQLKRPEITQCRNCQGYFHSASNCFLSPKCVKCDKNHEKGKCEVNEVPREELYCVLCKQFGHPASYKGCKIYQDLQKKMQNRKQSIRENQHNVNMYKSFINKDISFSSTLKNDHMPQSNTQNSPNNVFLLEIKNMMSNLTNQLVNMQKQLQVQASQIDVIFSMLRE